MESNKLSRQIYKFKIQLPGIDWFGSNLES